MILSPGETATVEFTTAIGSVPTNGTGETATVFLGDVATAVVPTISNPATGSYFVTFTVPAGWVDFNAAFVRLEVTLNGAPVSLTKPAGTVFSSTSDRMLEVWRIHGLDSTAPLAITDTTRNTIGINQTYTDAAGTTTVTRL